MATQGPRFFGAKAIEAGRWLRRRAENICALFLVGMFLAFVLREKDEVRFDIFYSALSEKTRCIFTVITGVIAIVVLTAALPAVYSYVSFLKVERSAYLGIKLHYLYSIYIIFSVAVIVRYMALVYFALRGRAPQIQIGAGSAL